MKKIIKKDFNMCHRLVLGTSHGRIPEYIIKHTDKRDGTEAVYWFKDLNVAESAFREFSEAYQLDKKVVGCRW